MRALAVVLLLLGATARGAHARGLLQGAPAAEAGQLRVGMQAGEDLFPVIYNTSSSQLTGYDVGVRDGVEKRAGITSQLVTLKTADERVTALESGSVDWVISAFTVTPGRAQRVDFVKPYYYSSGAAMFTPDGKAPAGITDWESVRGHKLAAIDGYYANDLLRTKYGAQLVTAPTREEATALVKSGTAEAYIDDSGLTRPPNNLQIVSSLPPLDRSPWAVAVKKGDTALADKISKALFEMATGGTSSELHQLEQQFFIANGAPPNPDLEALLANPKGNSALNPAR